MAKYLIDTSVFISHLRGHTPATTFLKSRNGLVMSFVTVGELIQGVRNKEDFAIVQKLLDVFDISWGSAEVNRLAVELLDAYYLKHGIHLLDALQAAVALSNQLVFVTDNLKHFQYIDNLHVEAPLYDEPHDRA